jgi:TonB family protein
LKKRLIILILLEFCAASLAAQNFAVAPALRQHIEALCDETLEGRLAGSEGERAAAAYLYKALEEAGVLMLTDSLGQDFTIQLPEGDVHSQNIVGIVQGSDPLLRDEYIVVGANYDHMGTNLLTVDGEPVVQLYPGADRNASGVAMLIELASLVADYQGLFRRSVIFVGFGAGEQGTAGAWYFVNRAFEQIGSVKAMIDLDCLGRGGLDHPLTVYSQLGGSDFQYLLNKTAEQPVVHLPEVARGVLPASDYLPFYERQIPVFWFSTGTAREHRTIKDTPRLIDWSSMENNCNYLYHFLLVAADIDELSLADADSGKRAARSERVHAVSDCDVRPQFFHSNERHFLQSWVYKYLKYPSAAIERNLQGQVLVSFIIEKDGSMTNVEVERGIDELLDDEAVRVISISPKWIPGQIRGEKVRTRMVLPVEFRLSSKWDIGLKK